MKHKFNDRVYFYESFFIKIAWFMITLGFIGFLHFYIFEASSFHTWDFVVEVMLFLVGISYNLLKVYLVKNRYFSKSHLIYYSFRSFELLMLSVGVALSNGNKMPILFVFFPIMITTLAKGTKPGVLLLFLTFLSHSIIFSFKSLNTHVDYSVFQAIFTEDFIFLTLNYSVLVLFTFLTGMIYKDNMEMENHRLFEEIQCQNEDLIETNLKLEETNTNLDRSIAEMYVLQKISSVLSSSALNVNTLLEQINDIILGVIGTQNSTILLYDYDSQKLRLSVTNINSSADKEIVEKYIDNHIVNSCFLQEKSIMDLKVTPEKYQFTKGRGVGSLICVPISNKSHTFGVILVEHRLEDAFYTGQEDLLNVIGQQLGISLENAELYRKMEELACKDWVTGIYNRTFFQSRFEIELNAAASRNYPLSIAIFDIDHFKLVNDTYGHHFGDKVLKELADFCSQSLRATDIYARFGGEEFVILIPHMDLSNAGSRIDQIRDGISHIKFQDGEKEISITVSFGVANFPENTDNIKDLLHAADNALYEAKASGRNCIKLARNTEG